jgi:septal ring factor EnvC (AmiA/AmiB activator)
MPQKYMRRPLRKIVREANGAKSNIAAESDCKSFQKNTLRSLRKTLRSLRLKKGFYRKERKEKDAKNAKTYFADSRRLKAFKALSVRG